MKITPQMDKLIQSYEPMMHKLLHRFKVKMDYEDNLQELRLATWQAILEYDAEIKKINKNKNQAKLSTLIHTFIHNRLVNILKVKYKSIKKEEIGEYSLKKSSKYNATNPEYSEELSKNDRKEILTVYSSIDSIRLDNDFNTFCDNLDDVDRSILLLKKDGLESKEISVVLKMPISTLNRKLRELHDEFKDFLLTGIKKKGNNYG